MSIFDINNINVDDIKDGIFVLDTNVLLWTFYPNASASNPNSISYSGFISDLISHNLNLNILSFNVSEFIYVIEKTERDIYCRMMNKNVMNLKKYRKISGERQKVQNTIKLAYSQIKAINNINIYYEPLNERLIDSYINSFNLHLLDFFDYDIVKFCKEKGYALITDDADFKLNASDIDIYTVNQKLITI